MNNTITSIEVMPYEKTLVEGFNRGDQSVTKNVFHADAIIHINGAPEKSITVNDFTQMVSGILIAFPDLKFTIEDQFAVDDKVATRWTATGTNKGTLGEMQPTGKRVNLDGLIIDYLKDGKVAERWEIWDQMAMLQQLGVM